MSRREPWKNKPPTSVEGYLLERIEVEPETGCWLWTGALHQQETGYGVACIRQQKYFAHRLAHEVFIGPIPPGFQVDHLCRVRRCICPDHIEAVTQHENLRRQAEANRNPLCAAGKHPRVLSHKCNACRRERWAEKSKDPAFRAAHAARVRADNARKKAS